MLVLGLAGWRTAASAGPSTHEPALGQYLPDAAVGAPAPAVGAPGPAGGASGPAVTTPTAHANPPAVDVGDQQAADPVRVRAAAINLDAAIVPLQVTDDVLEGPTRFSDAGWWQAGPEPGENGAAVIAAHVDSYRGPAAFFRLTELKPGDDVTVDRADGTSVTFRVTGAERYRKDALPLQRVFGATSGPTLRLLTCGGTFDRTRKTYLDNVVVYAVAVGAPTVAVSPPKPAAVAAVRVGTAPPLRAAIADTPQERRQGLRGRADLGPREGMLFRYPEPAQPAYVMSEVRVPLSLVFIRQGRVLAIREMPVCRTDAAACPRYRAPGLVDAVVEAPGGFFTDAGVKVGDRVRVTGR